MVVEQTSQSIATRYRINPDGELPLVVEIAAHLSKAGITQTELVRRMGYEATPTKGLRRLNALLDGDLKQYKNLRGSLASALIMDEERLDRIVEDTRYVLWARDDLDYRSRFTPHVVWDTEFRVPRPIAVAGLVSASRQLYFFPCSATPLDWSEEAAAHCPHGIPCYGVVHGFSVNYSPDCAVRFNRSGEPLEVMGRAVRPGTATASFR